MFRFTLRQYMCNKSLESLFQLQDSKLKKVSNNFIPEPTNSVFIGILLLFNVVDCAMIMKISFLITTLIINNRITQFLINSEMSGSQSFGVISLTVILILYAYAVSGAFFEHKHFHLIHETGLGIILGAMSGGLFYLLFHESLYQIYNFNGTFFFYILLPIIVFCGGYNLDKRRFAQNFSYVSLFGILGTMITFVIIFLLTYLVNYYELIRVTNSDEIIILSVENMMIFSATVCASDCVAALTMIKPDKYPKLFSVIFGEGMINDAVSIILFICVGLIFQSDNEAWVLPFSLILLFIKEFIGSFIVGWIIGILTTLVFKRLRFLTESVILEICIILYTGYATFAICELLELSGVISVLVCGVVLAHYNFYNLCNIGQISSKVTLSSLSLFCESFIYVYLGLALWAIHGDAESGRETMKTSWIFVLLQLAICFISRAFMIFALTMITQIFTGRKKFRLSFWELNIVWFAGLIRGSVAYALIQKLTYPENNIHEKGQVELLQTTVLFMVIVTTIGLGGLMPLYIAANLKIQEKILQNKGLQRNMVSEIESITVTFLGEIQGGIGEQHEKINKQSQFYRKLKYFEEFYLKRWFIFEYETRKNLIKQQKILEKGGENGKQKKETVLNPSIQSIALNQNTQKAIFRSTLQSKFAGVQEVLMTVDVPQEQLIQEEELKDRQF